MAGKQADIKVGVLTDYDSKGLDQAKTGLAGFKQKIDEADGAGGKLKAGFAATKDAVVKHAGLIAVGAGAALVEFGIKAVGAFTKTAKAAIDLGTSTGLAVEDASRWIAVGDDFQVGADALATGLGKIAKTMDSTKWEKYGIATRDAGGHARDVNDILLDSFDTLSKVDNKTEQARIGQELFGKGYQSLTPILGHTREEYEKMLGSVERGQVITSGEAKQAEKMRLAQDDLHDAVQDVTIAFGGLLAKLAPLLTTLAKGIGLIVSLTGDLVGLATGVDVNTEAIRKFFIEAGKHKSIKELGDALNEAAKAADKSHGFFSRLSTDLFDSRWDGINEVFKKMGKDSPEALKAVRQQLVELKAASDAGDPAARKLVEDYELTTEHLDHLYDAYIKVPPQIAETERETAKLSGTMSDALVSSDQLTGGFEHMGLTAAETTIAIQTQTRKVEAYQGQVDKTAREVASDIEDMQHKWDTLFDNLNAEKSLINLKQQAEDVKKANEDAGKAIKEHGPGSPEAIAAIDAARVKQIELEEATAQYAKDIAGLPPEVATRIAAEIGAGDIDKAIADVEQGFLNHSFRINAHLDTIVIDGETHAAGSTSISTSGITIRPDALKGDRAAGGPVSVGNYLVGEEGPEVVHMNGAGTVIPNNALGGGGGVNIGEVHLHVQQMPSPKELVALLAAYRQLNGPAAIQALTV